MNEPTVETHEISRRGGTLTVRVTYTPRSATALPMFHLKIESLSATTGLRTSVFVYQRSTVGAPMEDGSPRDEFVCVADELDEDEYPTEEQGPDPTHGMPYYLATSVELLFRNADLMYETARSLLEAIKCS